MTVETSAPATENPLSKRLAVYRERASQLMQSDVPPSIVVSPYRFNPLGAHIDHQGGQVLARTLDQYTLLAFQPTRSATVALHFDDEELAADALRDGCRFAIAAHESITSSAADGQKFARELDDRDSRVRYAVAASHVLNEHSPLSRGLVGVVHGTLIAAGLSSSASVILAYLHALASVNDITLDAKTLVELVRRVENEHLGLNNGLQDQMSVVFGRTRALSRLDVDAVAVTHVPDPPTVDEVRWLLCYSGVSRELATGSGFNTRVAECREAAAQLHASATRLGDVPPERRTAAALATLPDPLARRARHVFSEMQRVVIGCDAWRTGDWRFFGELMNASCASSIDDYESGSEWLIALHRIACDVDGVYGSRFSGGGYGGCLVMLVARDDVARVSEAVLAGYLACYPEKKGVARCFVATAEQGVRLA